MGPFWNMLTCEKCVNNTCLAGIVNIDTLKTTLFWNLVAPGKRFQMIPWSPTRSRYCLGDWEYDKEGAYHWASQKIKQEKRYKSLVAIVFLTRCAQWLNLWWRCIPNSNTRISRGSALMLSLNPPIPNAKTIHILNIIFLKRFIVRSFLDEK